MIDSLIRYHPFLLFTININPCRESATVPLYPVLFFFFFFPVS